jgi:hypothetical protein
MSIRIDGIRATDTLVACVPYSRGDQTVAAENRKVWAGLVATYGYENFTSGHLPEPVALPDENALGIDPETMKVVGGALVTYRPETHFGFWVRGAIDQAGVELAAVA